MGLVSMVVLITAAIALFVMIFSAGLSLGVNLVRPTWSIGRKALVSAGLGAGLPMLLAIGGLLTEIDMLWEGEASDFLLGMGALLLLTLVLAAVAGLPGAWMVSKRFEEGGEQPALEHEDAPLLADG